MELVQSKQDLGCEKTGSTLSSRVLILVELILSSQELEKFTPRTVLEHEV